MRTESIHVEQAQEADIEWCAQLMAGSEPWVTLRQDLKACRDKLQRPTSELFIAREGGERRGFILLFPHGLAGSPYISSVGVEAAARGRGVGTRLVEFAEQHYAWRRHIFLCVSSFNQRAQALYRRMGYAQVAEFPDYVVKGHSELLFYKKL